MPVLDTKSWLVVCLCVRSGLRPQTAESMQKGEAAMVKRKEWLGKSNMGTRKQSGSKTKEQPECKGEQCRQMAEKILQTPYDHFS